MKIDLKWSDELIDAIEMYDCAIFCDVLRATTTIISAIHYEAQKVITVDSAEEALKLKSLHPEFLLSGESSGMKIKGFDIGNNPSKLESFVNGQTLVLTTGNTTRVLPQIFKLAKRVFPVGIINAQSLADFILAQKFLKILCIPVGTYFMHGEELVPAKHTQEDYYGILTFFYYLEQNGISTGFLNDAMRKMINSPELLSEKLFNFEYAQYLLSLDKKHLISTGLEDMQIAFSLNLFHNVVEGFSREDNLFEFRQVI